MKKGWIIACVIIGVVLLVCGGIGFGVYSFVAQIMAMTQPVVNASDNFLGLLGQGKIDQAYAATSSGFRAQVDEATFTAAVQQLGLTDYASSSWNNRRINNQDGTVSGAVTSKKGGSTPATIHLVYEQGAWKVVGVRYGGVELTEFKPKQVPAEEELRRLTTETLLDLNQAVQTKDFTAFHAKIAAAWRQEKTPGQLQAIFQDLIDKKVTMDGVKNLQAQFDPAPTINEKGWLVVSGRYVSRPKELTFNLQYMNEPAGWKLASIDVEVADPK